MSQAFRVICAFCDCYIRYNNGVICLENAGQCPCLTCYQIPLTKKVSKELRKLRGDPDTAGDVPEVIQLDRDVPVLELLEHLEISDYPDNNVLALSRNTDQTILSDRHAESGCYILAERESVDTDEALAQPTEPGLPVTSPQVTSPHLDIDQLPRNDLTVPALLGFGRGPSAPGDMPSFIPLPGNTQYKPNVQTGQNQGQRRTDHI